MSPLCFGCGKAMDRDALHLTAGDLCGTCLARQGTPLTVACRCGCGRPASPYRAAFIGLSQHCAAQARIREGWRAAA